MTKISAMSQDTGPTLDDYLPTVDASTTANKRVTLQDLMTLLTANMLPSGLMQAYGGKTAPTGWQLCYGQAISRTNYASLFAAIVPSLGTVTTTIATPAVLTLSAHGLQTGDAVYLTTTGALPTGLSANTLYYAVKIDANTFNLATSRANAYAGTKIATSGSQSGTHTLRYCPFGLGDGSSTFNVPDMRGRVPAGNDSMGGTLASRLTLARSQGVYGNIGASGGAESHTLVTAELASHSHATSTSTGLVFRGTGGSNGAGAGSSALDNINAMSTGTAGSNTAHNNVQPTVLTNFIIKE